MINGFIFEHFCKKKNLCLLKCNVFFFSPSFSSTPSHTFCENWDETCVYVSCNTFSSVPKIIMSKGNWWKCENMLCNIRRKRKFRVRKKGTWKEQVSSNRSFWCFSSEEKNKVRKTIFYHSKVFSPSLTCSYSLSSSSSPLSSFP